MTKQIILICLLVAAAFLAFANPPVTLFIRGPIAPAGSSLLTDLVGYWKLNEASGARADSHSNGITLSDSNSVTSATGIISALAADFENGNNEYLETADSATVSLGSDTSFTITAWVKLESVVGSTRAIVGKRTGTAAADSEIFVGANTDENILFRVGNASTYLDVVNTNVMATGTWYFVACWHDAAANTLNVQVNDGTVASGSWSGGTFDGTGRFQVGTIATSTTGDWDGLIEGVGYWKRTLTSDERTSLYNSGAGLDYPF